MNFAKLINSNTTIIELDGKNNYRIEGAFLDIFPIDGAGETYKKAIKRRKKAAKYIKISSWTSYSRSKLKSKKVWKKSIMLLVQFFISDKKAKERLENFLRRKPYSQSNYVAVYVGQFGLKEVMKREIYGNPTKVKFNDHYFNAPAKPKEHLRIKYGDYIKLPPEEKRVSHHKIIYVNTELPFEKFDKEKLKEIDPTDKGK